MRHKTNKFTIEFETYPKNGEAPPREEIDDHSRPRSNPNQARSPPGSKPPHSLLMAFLVGRPSQVKRNGNAAPDFRGGILFFGVVGILGQMPFAQPPHFPAEIAEYVIGISRVFEKPNGLSLYNLQN